MSWGFVLSSPRAGQPVVPGEQLPERPGGLDTVLLGRGVGGKGRALCFLSWTWPRAPVITPGLFSFFSGMLEYDPAKRFSIQQIRQHK